LTGEAFDWAGCFPHYCQSPEVMGLLVLMLLHDPGEPQGQLKLAM
jgi:hypothetical protein